jgi:hypothetical protein
VGGRHTLLFEARLAAGEELGKLAGPLRDRGLGLVLERVHLVDEEGHVVRVHPGLVASLHKTSE